MGGQYEIERAHAGPPDLQDLLIVAVIVADADGQQQLPTMRRWPRLPAATALGLTDSAFVRIMLESQTDMEMLQPALG